MAEPSVSEQKQTELFMNEIIAPAVFAPKVSNPGWLTWSVLWESTDSVTYGTEGGYCRGYYQFEKKGSSVRLRCWSFDHHGGDGGPGLYFDQSLSSDQVLRAQALQWPPPETKHEKHLQSDLEFLGVTTPEEAPRIKTAAAAREAVPTGRARALTHELTASNYPFLGVEEKASVVTLSLGGREADVKLRFLRCVRHKVWPNSSNHVHPFPQTWDLQYFCLNEVDNSPELEGKPNLLKHYIVVCHDVSFECLAERYELV